MGRYSAFLTAIAPPNLPARTDVSMQLLPDLSNHMKMAGPFRNWQVSCVPPGRGSEAPAVVRGRAARFPLAFAGLSHWCPAAAACSWSRLLFHLAPASLAPHAASSPACLPRSPRPPPQSDIRDEDPMRTLMCYWPQPVSIVQALTIHRAWAKSGGRHGKTVTNPIQHVVA